MEPAYLKKTITGSLVPSGWKSKGTNWYRRTADVVQVINLQQSSFGPQFYLNIGIYLLSLGKSEFPKENHCHVRARASRFAPEDRQEFYERELFDLEKPISESDRARDIEELLRSYVLPFLDHARSLADLRSLEKQGALRRTLILADTRRLLASEA